MIELTDGQWQAVINGETVHLQPAEIGKNVVLLLEDQYEELRRRLRENEEDQILQEGWQKLAYRGLALAQDDDA
jgi:hypothetical protein